MPHQPLHQRVHLQFLRNRNKYELHIGLHFSSSFWIWGGATSESGSTCPLPTVTVKELWKSVNSYDKKRGGLLIWTTLYIRWLAAKRASDLVRSFTACNHRVSTFRRMTKLSKVNVNKCHRVANLQTAVNAWYIYGPHYVHQENRDRA